MQEYVKKKCSDVFKSAAGYLVEFEKPNIKKDFCFGHGSNGYSTQDEAEIARDNAAYARTNENYFLKENLEEFENWISILEGNEKIYLMKYNRKSEKLACLRTESYFSRYFWDKDKIVEELSKSDIEKLKKLILNEKAKFEKRLNTYLKRYGLSKIHSWTYLVD